MKSFTTLQSKYSMQQTQFYRYLQLRQQMEDLAESNPLEAKLLNRALGNGGISRSLVINSPDCFSALRVRWGGLVGKLDEDWRGARMAPRVLAISSRFRIIQLNTYTWYIEHPPSYTENIPTIRPSARAPKQTSPIGYEHA